MDSSRPMVSVIIPTFNRSKYVCEAVESVLQQTFKNFEIIVVDDGSRDGTRGVLQDRFGEKIRYFYQDNKGVASARNVGILNALGEIIFLLDSDDLLYDSALEEMVGFLLEHNDLALVFGDAEKFNDKEIVLESFLDKKKRVHLIPMVKYQKKRVIFKRKVFNELIEGNFIPCSCVAIRKICFDKVGLFDPFFRQKEDTDLFLRISRHYDIGFINKVLSKLRVHDNNLTRPALIPQASVYRIILMRRLMTQPGIHKFAKKQLSKTYFDLGWYCLDKKRILAAKYCFLKSYEFNKTNFLALVNFCKTTWLVIGTRLCKEQC